MSFGPYFEQSISSYLLLLTYEDILFSRHSLSDEKWTWFVFIFFIVLFLFDMHITNHWHAYNALHFLFYLFVIVSVAHYAQLNDIIRIAADTCFTFIISTQNREINLL